MWRNSLEAGGSGPHAAHFLHGIAHGESQEEPRHCRGVRTCRRANLDARVDIYAIGCVAYWLLTGQLVFTAENSMGLLLHHVHTAPKPPSARTELPIPEALDRLVLSCLQKNPAERPQSAKELSRRLAEIDGASGWTEDRAREWWARHQPARS